MESQGLGELGIVSQGWEGGREGGREGGKGMGVK